MATATIEVTTPACMHCDQASLLTITLEEHSRRLAGMAIQDALPTRSVDFRELFLNGIHPECWTEMFGTGEDDEDYDNEDDDGK